MKKPSSKIREDIRKLQEALKLAETREAERIGRIAIRAGLGELDIGDSELHSVFETLASRFRNDRAKRNGVSSDRAGHTFKPENSTAVGDIASEGRNCEA